MVRIYLNTDNFSLAYDVKDNAMTFLDLSRIFIEELTKKRGEIALKPEGVTFVNTASEKEYLPMDLVVKKVKDKQDIQVVLKKLDIETKAGSSDDVNNRFDAEYLEASELMKKERYKAAAQIYNKILESDPKNFKALTSLGEIYFKANRYKEALKCTKDAMASSRSLELFERLGEIYFYQKDYDKAIEAFTLVMKSANSKLKQHNLAIAIGKAMYAKGEREAASQIFMSVIKENEMTSTEHFSSYLNYAKALIDTGKNKTAAQILIRLIVKDTKDKEVRQYLAEALSGVDPIETLEEEIRSSAASLAFVALAIRDYGALISSNILFGKACDLVPDSTTYALSYLHSFENIVEYQKGFLAAKKILKRNLNFQAGGVSLKNLLTLIDAVEDITKIEGIQIELPAVQPNSISDPSKKYTDQELDILAIYFTIIKIIFLSGALALIPPLCKLVEPLREGRDLHLTDIRNESAYQHCIATLSRYHRIPFAPEFLQNDDKVIYVCGDSHCTSLGWQTLKIKGENYLLKPLLATGMKVWHLRPESTFYPKGHFYNLIDTVGKGKKVMFVFGEIDCRESFLVSVEKCRYDNIVEAATVAIDIYITALLNLKKTKNLTIFVHPVNPVLNETRMIVRLFNEILEKKIKATKELLWLDFFDSLLTEDKSSLKKEYDLDGTHMNPSYIPLIEESIEKVMK